jgi:enoyl-CoA hydratase
MAGTPVLRIDGAIARIELDRPEQANRLGPDDLEVLQQHVATADAAPAVKVLQLAARGRYFCSGYDISQIGEDRGVDFEAVVDRLEAARPVTMAILQGGVYGGATDLVLACDFRLGAEGIDLFMPAARLGLHYYRSGLERYVSRLGLDEAKRLFLTAERIDARRMKEIGYLTDLEPAGSLADAAARLAERLSEMAPIPLFAMKKHLNRIARGTLDAADLARDIERAANSADLVEGKAAWAAKRLPRFTGT